MRASLRFYQLVAVARSISRYEQDNKAGKLILATNELRNQLGHSLNPNKRQQKVDQFKAIYAELQPDDDEPDHRIAIRAVSLCLGFLIPLESEVEQFRSLMNTPG